VERLSIATRHGRVALRTGGEGPAVLLLHGIPGSGAAWDPVAERLADRVRLVVPDLLGFGASDRPADRTALLAPAQARALAEVLDALGLGAVTVVGHDFGGPVALLLAGERPDRVAALGLLAANTFPDTPVPMPLALVRWPLVGRLAAPLLFSRASLATMLRTGVPSASLGGYLGDAAQSRAVRTIFETSLRRLGELYAPVAAQLRALAVPAFVGWGDRDPFFPLDQGRRTADVAGARLAVYPGAGHFLPAERPHEVAADIAALVGSPGWRRAPR
jgi:pimeloyl-ACP methyl ester carboxylesterase